MKNIITLDYLYDLMYSFVADKNREPTYVLIHPKDSYNLEDQMGSLGYNYRNVDSNTVEFRGIKFIRSQDIEIGKPEII